LAKQIILLGDTEVGKTTTLGAAFSNLDLWSTINLAESNSAIEEISQTFFELSQRGSTEPTSLKHIDFNLKLKNNTEVNIRDVKGGLLWNVKAANDDLQFNQVSVALFFLEWKSPKITSQINAISGVLPLLASAKKGLVFTKCEKHLSADDEAWESKEGWWQIDPSLHSNRGLLESFHDKVWCISNIGFHGDTGFPSLLLGDFGQHIPFKINPINASKPLFWALQNV